jgi:hypothetical protein
LSLSRFAGEVIGWVFRLTSHWEPLNKDCYIGQIAILVISPTFFSAALYWCLGLIIQLVAPQHSLLSPKAFKINFVIADFISLVVQGVGGEYLRRFATRSVRRGCTD